jgi:hypothetical protein
VLAQLGLAPDPADPTRLAGLVAGDLADALAAGRRLAEAGLAAAELSVREPSLYGVFFHVTGKELAE